MHLFSTTTATSDCGLSTPHIPARSFMHTKVYQRMDTILNVTLLGEVVTVQDYKEWHGV